MCGLIFLLLIFAVIIIIITKLYLADVNQEDVGKKLQTQNIEKVKEGFIAVEDSKLYMPQKRDPPAEIQYQIPIAKNQLTDVELQNLDTDVLRDVRRLKGFTLTDELTFHQMYNLLKDFKYNTYTFTFNPSKIDKKSSIKKSEKLIELNTGVINTTDLELFYRLKLELISALNSLIVRKGYYLPYHEYQFYKIINNNLISQTKLDTLKASPNGSLGLSVVNYVFTVTIAREFKYQQFVIYYDLDLIQKDSQTYEAKLNKVELIGLPIPKTIEFHENRKTTDMPDTSTSSGLSSSGGLSGSGGINLSMDLMNLIENDKQMEREQNEMLDIYKDQVSDSQHFDVQGTGDSKTMFQSPNTKFIDPIETSDLNLTMFDPNSQNAYVEDRKMSVARDQQFKNHRCYGLVNGVSQELVSFNDNPIFCKSFHPEVGQNGIWDAPCQVNSDCPFYQANKNYPNEFGKCDKVSGQCEMPLGVVPIGFTKYGRIEPDCYNCDVTDSDNKCCGKQADKITKGEVKYNTPDYVFKGDEIARKKNQNELSRKGLLVNPSI
jgi:hypothetical protein